METPEITLPLIADGEDKSSPFKNRIRNNYRHVRKWAKRTHTNCFRIYDREIATYPLAIDYYDGRFCVQHFSKIKDQEDAPAYLITETESALLSIFNAHPDKIFWRTRMKREKAEQYEKLDAAEEFFTVIEFGVKFYINLTDYLDTGLFLDHRETRKLVAQEAAGKRVLNLFAYTCSFSVHAALAGAVFTKSVDLSNTYTDWGRQNFALNQIPPKSHPIIRADCLKFLEEETQNYDLIIIDPPTISRSKKMDQMFDIQRDYVFLIERSLKLLAPGGVIFFSTNSRKFSFDLEAFPHTSIRDITHKTIPLDFHHPKIHYCWRITKA